MPKLDGTHIVERLQQRLQQLRDGEEVAVRELRSLLNEAQQAAMNAAWEEQQLLRKSKRARNKQQEVALGWKTKRDIQIAAIESALKEGLSNENEIWQRKLRDAEVRRSRIYLDEFFSQLDGGVDKSSAAIKANNALTRAGLQRLDGQSIGRAHLSKRDREIREFEDEFRQQAESELSEYEREQLDLLREHERAVEAKRKRSSK